VDIYGWSSWAVKAAKVGCAFLGCVVNIETNTITSPTAEQTVAYGFVPPVLGGVVSPVTAYEVGMVDDLLARSQPFDDLAVLMHHRNMLQGN